MKLQQIREKYNVKDIIPQTIKTSTAIIKRVVVVFDKQIDTGAMKVFSNAIVRDIGVKHRVNEAYYMGHAHSELILDISKKDLNNKFEGNNLL